MLKVIYEDNHLLVCEKPVNMPAQADSTGDTDLLSVAKAYIKAKYNKPGEVYLGLVHRLDRPVGGIMVFARTSKAAARLAESFKTRRTEKRYAAIVSGEPKDNERLDDFLLKDENANSSRVADAKTPGAKAAALEYAKVTEKQGLKLLDILLLSGRHHQIRVQLKNAGFPIYGDQRYNANAKAGQQIALYAYSVTIEHPTLKTLMTFSSIPEGKAWKHFSEELKALVNGVKCSYIDENVICVNKASGIATTAGDAGEGAESLETALCRAFGRENIFPVHRLDVPTTGLVLFARNSKAKFILTQTIRERALNKVYRAEVFGHPGRDEGELSFFLLRNSEKAEVQVFDSKVPGAVEAKTMYKVLRTYKTKSLLELKLVTGRTHQIRASLAYIGCPIIGDDKYGNRKLNKGERGGLHLAAVRIEFPKQMKMLKELNGKIIEIQAPF